MATLVGEYIRSWDKGMSAWAKRGDAADFAAFLAGELKITPKAVLIDKDGKFYRVYVPLLSAYWSPLIADAKAWEESLSHFKQEMKSWASA